MSSCASVSPQLLFLGLKDISSCSWTQRSVWVTSAVNVSEQFYFGTVRAWYGLLVVLDGLLFTQSLCHVESLNKVIKAPWVPTSPLPWDLLKIYPSAAGAGVAGGGALSLLLLAKERSHEEIFLKFSHNVRFRLKDKTFSVCESSE